VLLSAFLVSGCASGPRPVETKTQLGSVIVYRNGVAYFERYAGPGEKEIKLRVPTERVDDFLSSLSIIDEDSNQALPVSYPTVQTFDGYVEMTIALPEKHGRLKIWYVTESPAWKPSYRVVLADNGKARLHGWAVVDNVSGEDWKNVQVGVGSTSALTFRYDLHSVRLVERETLTTSDNLALAPPTGDSSYTVATKKVRVIGGLDSGELAQVQGGQTGVPMADSAGAEQTTVVAQSTAGNRHSRAPAKDGKAEKSKQRVIDKRYWDGVRAQAGQHRIRVEGFAQTGDADPNTASLARANSVKDQLIANGVPADRIDVVGNPAVNSKEAVRVLATDEEQIDETKAAEAERAAADTLPVGHAHFLSKGPMSIKSDHSAMVSMLNQETQAKRVYYYDPISPRGSKKVAFNAVRIYNPSEYTLDAGPFTVYAGDQFLGEGLSEAILPKSSAFIPYALDQSVMIEPEEDTREEIERLVTIQRGVVSTETRRIRRTKLTIVNRGESAAEVYLRHKVAPGFTLTKDTEDKVEKLNGAHLFNVDVAGHESVELVIEEWTPLMKTVDIRTDVGIRDIGLFLRKRQIEPQLKAQLEALIASHRDASNLQEKIDLIEEQMAVYRTRIDEINVQLFTLKKVPQAGQLRGHLQKKMEEISEKLQAATLEVTDLKGQLMALRIDVQDKLAELTLENKDDKVAQK
jgi:hypothetical protein